MISVCFQGKPFNITVIQAYAPTSNAEETEVLWMVLWRPTRPSKTNIQKRCPFHYRGLECTNRKSRNTWNNGQIWPWSTEWSRAKSNRVLQRERTGHSKHPLPTTQEKTLHMDITRWSTLKSDGLYSLQPKMKKLYTVSKNKTGSWLWLRSWTPYWQIQASVEKVGKTIMPFSSVQFSSVTQLCTTLWPHELQHTRPPCPSPIPRVYPNSYP